MRITFRLLLEPGPQERELAAQLELFPRVVAGKARRHVVIGADPRPWIGASQVGSRSFRRRASNSLIAAPALQIAPPKVLRPARAGMRLPAAVVQPSKLVQMQKRQLDVLRCQKGEPPKLAGHHPTGLAFQIGDHLRIEDEHVAPLMATVLKVRAGPLPWQTEIHGDSSASPCRANAAVIGNRQRPRSPAGHIINDGDQVYSSERTFARPLTRFLEQPACSEGVEPVPPSPHPEPRAVRQFTAGIPR